MEWHQVLIQPLITEKSTEVLGNTESKCICYPFEVNGKATKTEIKLAVQKMVHDLFEKEIKVQRVNTAKMPGKIRKRGRFVGKSSDRKKAYIYVNQEDAFEII